MSELRAPFPYFGGKAAIAETVWAALGSPGHYLEPFFGSGAVLLARPNWTPDCVETVCDADGLLANVWRALQRVPDAVAKVCDWPVNHADLMARRRVLLRERQGLLDRLLADDEYYDARLAGYWIWAASCWIGSGLTRPGAIPHVSGTGHGVHAAGKIPHLGHGGKGVHRLGIGSVTSGGDVRDPYTPSLWTWFRALSERLRRVRVVCGDWSRICGGDWQADMGTAGIFFDPPYGAEAERDPSIYDQDALTVADDVAAWCLSRGEREDHRIVLCGYEGEHGELVRAGWTVRAWTARGGYANQRRNDDPDEDGEENRKRERLFLSPAAARQLAQTETPLFSAPARRG